MWIAVVPVEYTIYCTPALSQKQNLVPMPPEPKHRTTVLQPGQSELDYMHATHRHTNLKSRGKRGRSTLTQLAPKNHVVS